MIRLLDLHGEQPYRRIEQFKVMRVQEDRVTKADCVEHLRGLSPSSVDLIVTSPPYFMGKEYDRSLSAADFEDEVRALLPLLKRALKPGGVICWQVGYHIENGIVLPLDWMIDRVFRKHRSFKLRNRIVWTFGHGEHCTRRFSGRHETILAYSLGDHFYFDLDSVRQPQKYPGKRHYRGPKKGELSGNPLGKNPGDVWEIPNVKSKHVEKTAHPCQFPVALVGRLIRAFCPPGGLVLDPYAGSGSTAVAAIMEGRRFTGCDISEEYVAIANDRIEKLGRGELEVRPDVPVMTPDMNSAVARRPDHFVKPEQVDA